jgi:hypothetical protein
MAAGHDERRWSRLDEEDERWRRKDGVTGWRTFWRKLLEIESSSRIG